MNPDFATKAANFLRTQNAMRKWHEVAFITKDVSDFTLGQGNFTQGVPAFWFARGLDGGGSDGMNRPYAQSAWVRRAIKYVSGPISSVDLVFSKPSTSPAMRRFRGKGKRLFTSRGIVQRDATSEMDLPQVREFLREPMIGLTFEDFVEASLGWMKLAECFWVMADDTKRVPFPDVHPNPFNPIIVARPDRMRPTMETVNGRRQVAYWNFTDEGGKVWELDPEQVIQMKGWNPYDDVRGLGDYASAHLAAETHHLASKFKRNLTADNDTAPIISAKNGTPTDTQIEQIKMSIQERRMARMRGQSKTLFLPGEVDVHDPKVLSVDAAFVAGMLEDRHEIFVAFGVPPGLADVKASYSIGQASDWFALIHNTCIPEGGKFCAAIEVLIKRLTGETVEVGLDWDEHYVMQQVRSERMKDGDSLFAKGVPMTVIDEYLNLGLPDYDAKDQGFVPINITPVTKESIEADLTSPAPQPGEFNENDKGDDESDPVKQMLVALKNNLLPPPVIRSSKNEALWQQHMKLRAKSVKLIQGKCSKVFNDYRAQALKKLEHATKGVAAKSLVAKSLVDVIFNYQMFGVDLFKSLDPAIRSTLQTAGEELNKEIGNDDPWTLAPMQAKHFISLREGKIKDVGETAQAILNNALATGLDAGETTDQLADRVRGVFNNLQKFEARRIAMTETSAAYGFSRHQAMTDAGIEYKAWLTSHGPNVRAAHAQAEDDYGDSPIPIDEPFIVDGEKLMHPGDESGSPGNVINCHCIQIAAQPPEEKE
jgi:hypothetical protein